MLIDLIEFYATETTWTLEADVKGDPVTLRGGILHGRPDFHGVDFGAMPGERTAMAITFLLDRLEGEHEGCEFPVAVRVSDLYEAEDKFFPDF